MAKSALLRRRGTIRNNHQQYRTSLVIGLVVLLIGLALLLGMLLGANLLLTPATEANLIHKEAAAATVVSPQLLLLKNKGNNQGKPSNLRQAVEKSLANHATDDFPDKKAKTETDSDAKEATNKNKSSPTKPIKPIQLGGPYPYPLDEALVPRNFDFTTFTPKGGSRFAEYTNGTSPYAINDDIKKRSDQLARSRRVHIKNAMKFAYNNYEKYAFGHDEVLPQTKSFNDNWGGIGTTLVDSLDTLWLMGLKEEFWRARDWVRDSLKHGGAVSVFETTIRSLGGLLAAYDWSHDEAFLAKAADLGKRLFKAFNNPSGLPFSQVDLTTGRGTNIGWTGGNVILSEVGTVQLEFRYLAKAIKKPEYATKSEAVFEILSKMKGIHNGLYSYFIRSKEGEQVAFANNRLTFGAMSDSVYEYMLKVWIQGGKTEPLYRDMYDKAMDGMHKELLKQSTPSGLWYIADMNNSNLDTKMDHLVCFMGGLLALGAYTDPLGLMSDRAQRDLQTAKALTYTCYQMYARMNTGISAEFVQFVPDKDFEIGRGAPHYLLRPEAVESFFVLNQLTGDPIYREWGWEVFMALEKYCKTEIAYGSLHDVSQVGASPEDKMESFFLAETLKYLYLLQDPDTEVDILNKHVFNTEAHPTRIFPVIDAAGVASEA